MLYLAHSDLDLSIKGNTIAQRIDGLAQELFINLMLAIGYSYNSIWTVFEL